MGIRGPIKLEKKRAEMERQRAANTAGRRQTVPKMPSWLSEEAKKEWRRVAKPLWEMGLLSDLDINTLALYCETWATYLRNLRVLQEEGDVYEQASGNLKQRPEYYIARDAQQELREFIKLFGLSPSARMRMELPGTEDPGDPMSELLD